MGLTYKDAGVDTTGGQNFVKKIAPFVKETFSERVETGIGGFSALFNGHFPDMEEPILVSGTDGVGTKLKLAQMMDKHDTIGIDAVAMCVNDIITSGASPLFFLDYIACGKLKEHVLVDVVKGIAQGCKESGCSLIGGETAEHPGVMADDDYDIAGFTVGVVDKKKIITGKSIGVGDFILSLPSSGVHSNGFSLVRKVFFDIKKYTPKTHIQELSMELGEALLVPTRLYAKQVQRAIADTGAIKGLIHITGGGFQENIPRILPKGTSARIDEKSLPTLPIFSIIEKEGAIAREEMYKTFNMGVGMMAIVSKDSVDKVVGSFTKSGENCHVIGEVISGEGEVEIV